MIFLSAAEAEQALADQDFATAARALEQLRQRGEVSPQLYLAQGNAYYQTGELGRAVLAYERGLRLRPGNKALKNNLQFVEGQLEQQLSDLPGFFLLRWWKWMGSRLGPATSAILAIILWWGAVALFALWYFKREEFSDRRRFLLLPLSVVCLLLSLLLYSLGQSREAELARQDLAVLVDSEADLRVAPGAEATLEKRISAGLRLRIVDTFKDEYVKVVLRDGKQGWLPVDALEVI
ncbi:MAG: hypothetical protein AAF828_00785 [Bacteroidota bacterium]